MSVTAVLSSPPTKAVQTPLDRLVQTRKAVYINRHRETSKLCAKLQVHPKRSPSMTTEGCKVALHAELLVVSGFLKRSGFVDLSNGDAKSTCLLLAPPFMYTWVVYEWMLSTIRNFGHNSQRIFFLDESQLDLTEAAVSEYYATDPDVLDPWHVGRLGVTAFADTLEASRKLARARLDETESAVLTLVQFIRSVNYQICNQGIRLQPLLDTVLRNLDEHYKQTYDEYALRLDVIRRIADKIQHVRRTFDELVILLRLYGRKAMMSDDVEDRVRREKLQALNESL